MNSAHGVFKSYLFGFLMSISLTLVAYLVVVEYLFTGWALNLTIAGLGLLQAWVQLVLFLDFGGESKAPGDRAVFFFMVTVTLVLVFGSLWIMNNLNYHLMMHE